MINTYRIVKLLINLPIVTFLIYAAFAGHSIFVFYGTLFFFIIYMASTMYYSRLQKIGDLNSEKTIYFIFITPTLIFLGLYTLINLGIMVWTNWNLGSNEYLTSVIFFLILAVPNVLQEILSARNFINNRRKHST
jgi:hypothetical protein